MRAVSEIGVASLRDDLKYDRRITRDSIAIPKNNMNCPQCNSNQIRKNGNRRGKQNYQCKSCGRQFIEYYSSWGYSKKIQEDCLTMYVNGNGFRAIERITQVNHNTVIRWVKKVGSELEKKNKTYKLPTVSQLDELQTFVGKKK
jgi:insertion element IS1 protein InsB